MPEVHYSAGLGEGVLVVSGSAFVVVRGRLDGVHAERIWAALRYERPLPEVLDAVTRGRLGELPDFVVCVPNASGGWRIVQRPGLGIVTIDPTGAREAHSAQDSALWSERSVPAGRSIEVDLTGAGAGAGTLPLESGAVPATFVLWSPDDSPARDAARKTQPSSGSAAVPGAHEAVSRAVVTDAAYQLVEVEADAGAATPTVNAVVTHAPELDLGDETETAAVPAVDRPDVEDPEANQADVDEASSELNGVMAAGLTVSGVYTITEEQLAAVESQGVPVPVDGELTDTDAATEVDPYDSLFGATTHRSVEGAAVRPGSEEQRTDEPPTEAAEPFDLLDPSPSALDVVAQPFVVDERLVSDAGGSLIDSVPVVGHGSSTAAGPSSPPPGDHDGLTISAAALRQLRQDDRQADRPAQAQVAATPVVHAITCVSGHPNPPQSGTCRVCGSPLAFQEPITVPRPPLGVLVFAGGHEVTLDRYVLIGRSPAVERVAPGDLPHVVKLDSPDKDVSRNHVEIRLEGWHVLVVDLQSTNGTVVQLPGRPPERVHPLEPYAIVPGTVVTVGDEQSFVYEVRG